MTNKRNDRRIEKTEAAIKQAFFELLETKDINKISVTELSAKANIDRKTFYLHYDTVYGIIEEYKSEVYEKARDMIKSIKAYDINALFNGFSRMMNEDITLYRYIATKRNLRYLQYEWKEILKDCFYDAYAETTTLSPQEFNVYSEFIASGIIGMYIDRLIDDRGIPLDEFTEYGINAARKSWNDYLRIDE